VGGIVSGVLGALTGAGLATPQAKTFAQTMYNKFAIGKAGSEGEAGQAAYKYAAGAVGGALVGAGLGAKNKPGGKATPDVPGGRPGYPTQTAADMPPGVAWFGDLKTRGKTPELIAAGIPNFHATDTGTGGYAETPEPDFGGYGWGGDGWDRSFGYGGGGGGGGYGADQLFLTWRIGAE
jgi:hypothetical protein